LGKIDDRFQTVPRNCDDVGTTERREWDQLSKESLTVLDQQK